MTFDKSKATLNKLLKNSSSDTLRGIGFLIFKIVCGNDSKKTKSANKKRIEKRSFRKMLKNVKWIFEKEKRESAKGKS